MTICAEPTSPSAHPGDAMPCDAIVETGSPPQSDADHRPAPVKGVDAGPETATGGAQAAGAAT